MDWLPPANLADAGDHQREAFVAGVRGGLPRGRRHQALVLWELALPLLPEAARVIRSAVRLVDLGQQSVDARR
jgi:hypothetical protein